MTLNITYINDNIYLGGLYNSTIDELNEYIKNNNITSIITIWNFNNLKIDSLGIKPEDYLYIRANDDIYTILMNYFDLTYNFIKNKLSENKKILIHCYAGLSRSATILLNYFMSKYNYDFYTAYNIINSKRNIYPNTFFVNQLKIYHKNL